MTLPILNFHHIGIVAATVDSARSELALLLGITSESQVFSDHNLGVKVQFLYDEDGVCYEIIAPLSPLSPVTTTLHSSQNILNHLAYTTPNLDETVSKLRLMGYFPVGESKPALAFDGRRIQFLLTPLRFLIEIIESNHEVGSVLKKFDTTF